MRLNVGMTGAMDVPSKSWTVIATALAPLFAMATFLMLRWVVGAGESVGPGDGTMT